MSEPILPREAPNAVLLPTGIVVKLSSFPWKTEVFMPNGEKLNNVVKAEIIVSAHEGCNILRLEILNPIVQCI